MRNGRAVRLGEPVECHALKARATDWDPIRGSHHGQRPKWLQQQAEYMTAPDIRGNVRFLLHRGRRPYMALKRRRLYGLLTYRESGAFRTWMAPCVKGFCDDDLASRKKICSTSGPCRIDVDLQHDTCGRTLPSIVALRRHAKLRRATCSRMFRVRRPQRYQSLRRACERIAGCRVFRRIRGLPEPPSSNRLRRRPRCLSRRGRLRHSRSRCVDQGPSRRLP